MVQSCDNCDNRHKCKDYGDPYYDTHNYPNYR